MSYVVAFNSKGRSKRGYLCDIERVGSHTTGRRTFAKLFQDIGEAEEYIKNHMVLIRNAEKRMVKFPEFEIVDMRIEKGTLLHTMDGNHYRYLNKARNSLATAFGSVEKFVQKTGNESVKKARENINDAYNIIQDELDLVEKKYLVRYIHTVTRGNQYKYIRYRRILNGWICYAAEDRLDADRFTKEEAEQIIEGLKNENKEIKCKIPMNKIDTLSIDVSEYFV